MPYTTRNVDFRHQSKKSRGAGPRPPVCGGIRREEISAEGTQPWETIKQRYGVKKHPKSALRKTKGGNRGEKRLYKTGKSNIVPRQSTGFSGG